MKKKRHEEHENHERWLVSYADFITLLFAFFVVLYATSNQNQEKEKKFEDSFRQEMNMKAGGAGAGSGNSESNKLNLDPAAEIKTVLQQYGLSGESLDQKLQDEMSEQLKEKIKEKKIKSISMKDDPQGIRISILDTVFFESGSAVLKPTAAKVLKNLSEVLNKSQNQILVEGHTDNIPVDGKTFESNWELASLRATRVVRSLINEYNVQKSRLGALSYADQKPVADNSDEVGRIQNRRIEILIVR